MGGVLGVSLSKELGSAGRITCGGGGGSGRELKNFDPYFFPRGITGGRGRENLKEEEKLGRLAKQDYYREWLKKRGGR